ncbi:MAG: ABC transporter permease [Theionarchaea archaeon]|nr:ABC transporter permease [Theionarchaea archaeon]MBU7038307.1 ABC transporter permease [Theionarchaea archaeon]
MRFDDLIRIVIRNLNRVRTRTILTTLGVIIGVAAIVTLLSVAMGFQQTITGQLEEMSDITQITVSQARFGPGMIRGGGAVAQSEEIKILDDDVVEEIEAFDGVEAVIPIVSTSSTIEVGRYTTRMSSITGIDPRNADDMDIEMMDGRFLRNNDKNVIVVGYSVNDEFMEKKTEKTVEDLDIQGKNAEIIIERTTDEGEAESRSIRVRIVGVMAEQGTESDYRIYAPLDLVVEIKEWTMQESNLLKEEGYDRLTVKATDSSVVDDLTEKITELGFQAFSSKQIIDSMNQIFVILQIFLVGIGAISLFVAALGITNTMMMSIMERTREIGIMKVIGASNSDVTRIFLMEALFIGLLGGVGGVILGYVISKIIDLVAGSYLTQQGATAQSISVMPLWLIAFALGFAMLVGLVSGVYPAGKAARLSPVEALRHD